MALHDTSRRLGLHFDMNTRSWLIYPHLITPLLFLGPLYSRYLSESLPFQRRWFFRSEVLPIFFTWQGIRNYLLVSFLLSSIIFSSFSPYTWQAPITEELVFRACVLSMYHLSGASTKRMIFLSPLSFGAGTIFLPHYELFLLTTWYLLSKLTSTMLGIHTTDTERHQVPSNAPSS
jgi:prenyl protein peptidase